MTKLEFKTKLPPFVLAITTVSLISYVLAFTTDEATARNHKDRPLPAAKTKNLAKTSKAALSKKVYRQGKVVVELYSNSLGIDSISAYSDRRLLLHKSLKRDYKDGHFMWLSFPYVSKRTRLVHKFDGGIDDFISISEKSASSPFVHFDRTGAVNLIVAHNLGNAATIYNIYSLQGRSEQLPAISATRSEAQFIDIDHDGVCEVISSDPSFFGWKTSNADSPMPMVVLRLDHKRFKLATALMRTNPPSESRQQEILNSWRKICTISLASSNATSEKLKTSQMTFKLPPVVWRDMLNLVYSGNSDIAFKLLNKFWTPSCFAMNLEVNDDSTEVRTSKEKFEFMFLHQLSCSEYLEGLKVLNNRDARIRALSPQKDRASSI